MRVLMLVWSDVAGDARVLREATCLAEAGHDVHVIGRSVPAGWTPPEGVSVESFGAPSVFQRSEPVERPARRLAPLRLARWLLLPSHVSSALRAWTAQARPAALAHPCDVVHAHDFNVLGLAAEVARAHGARLVYDTHELWSGRPRSGRPTPLRRRRELRAERALGGAADAVITVGEGVAAQLTRIHGWPEVTVVHNSFPLRLDRHPPAAPRGLLYAGRLAAYRQLEVVVAAAAQLPELDVVLAGPADPTYLAAFDPGRTRLLGRLPLDEVDELYTSLGLALVTHSDRWPNHRLALPNKLFHAVACGIPVVATDVPELRRVVSEHGLGTLYTPDDPASLVAAVRAAVRDYPALCANVARARPALAWEGDARRLVDVYDGLRR